jgi:outer membrane protein OmpA-like peptidoglycan-associated protein
MNRRGMKAAVQLALLWAGMAHAQTAERLSSDELERRLGAPAAAVAKGFSVARVARPAAPPAPGTDGRCDAPSARATAPAGQAAALPLGGDEQPRVDLALRFGFNSDKLAAPDRAQLDELAAALQRPALRGFSFTIAGHTDAAGSAELNQRLSCARSRAVHDYLVGQGVALDRLGVYGFGASQPSGGGDAQDRRVEIRRTGS